MKQSFIYILVGLFTGNSIAQKQDLSLKYSVYIDSVDLKKHLTVLASDAYEGRETGKKGQQMTAEYLIASFKQDGCSLAPGMTVYEQFFDVIESTPGGNMSIGSHSFEFKTDFIYFGAKRKWNAEKLPIYTLEAAKKIKPSAYILVATLSSMDVRAEVAAIKKDAPAGYKSILLVTTNYAQLYEYLEHYTTQKTMRLADETASKEETPTIVINSVAFEKVLLKKHLFLVGKGKNKKAAHKKSIGLLSANFNSNETKLTSSNVLAYIPGSDPILSKEIVVITAHYDHIGVDNGVVYNGADDDGTGTVALLEIAEAFMQAKKEGNAPRRSILIMPVSGEEKGLLGSAYYAAHPIIPLENTIADLNIDMIGRNDIAHEKTNDYIYIIGSNMISDDLHNANEAANTKYTQLKLDYKFNDLNDPNQFYYRSDHYNFAKNGIPSVFYFSGVHDDYHQPTDDIEKIIFSKVEKVSRLVFHTAWILANKTERPALKM